MLRSLIVLLVSVAVLLCVGMARTAPRELRVLIWSDYIDPELVKAFEEKAGAKVTLDLYEETEAMMARLQAQRGAGYDLVVASDHAIPVLAKLGLLTKLDAAKLPNAKNVDTRFVRPPYDPKGEYALPYQWGTVGVIYNKAKFPQGVGSWNALFDAQERAKHGAKIVLLDSPRDTLGAALKLGGKSVNARSPADVQAAGRLVLGAKQDPRFVAFVGSVAACKQVVSGQADLAMAYNGDALNAIKEAKEAGKGDFDYAVPAEGGIIWVDTMVIPSGAKEPELAHRFMDFLLDADNGAKLSNFINYATPNAAALPKVDEASRSDPRIYPTPGQLKTLEYLEDVGDATRIYDSVWTAVKAR